jgi:hypothetical protein
MRSLSTRLFAAFSSWSLCRPGTANICVCVFVCVCVRSCVCVCGVCVMCDVCVECASCVGVPGSCVRLVC